MFYDSHAHFGSFASDEDIVSVVERAKEAGLSGIIAVGGSPAENAAALNAARLCPETVRAAVGYDRDEAASFGKGERESDLDELAGLLSGSESGPNRAVALGEIGLDYHYSGETAPAQRDLFRRQLEIAAQARVPAIIHSREAEDDTVEIIDACIDRELVSEGRGGVLHCFTGSISFAGQIVELGMYVSFSGIVTFRGAGGLHRAVREVPDDRLLIETDTPRLAPEPHRGKRNEPAHLKCIAETIAELRGCAVEELAEITAANAARLFKAR
ncbi:MAG: TatD family hydrolase [Kiritimatiellia bacterium]